MASEKFCLRWNDFESNISVAFRELRDDKDFFDVTLACDDEQIQAHKVILSACSPFFRSVLRRNPHAHPLLYLKGVKYSDLQSVLNFMYHGEVNVAQEELNSFLAVAEELRVKGLTQSQAPPGTRNPTTKPAPSPPAYKPRPPDPPQRSRPPPPPPAPVEEEVQEVVMPSVKSEVVPVNEYEGVMEEADYQEEDYEEHYDQEDGHGGAYLGMAATQPDGAKGEFMLHFLILISLFNLLVGDFNISWKIKVGRPRRLVLFVYNLFGSPYFVDVYVMGFCVSLELGFQLLVWEQGNLRRSTPGKWFKNNLQ